ncbi:MAG: nucleotidyltransferase domain-containing protein [Deltaproteobacteria bacterium]|nr:nucleotidyltransferase domain-containing protein [Deltaproteobacteria bacterium]
MNNQLKTNIKKIITNQLGNKVKIFLFGSRADNTHTKQSDYDIGIISNTPIPFDTMQRIKENIDKLPILQQIDIIDFKRVNADFYNKVLSSENSVIKELV